MTDHSPMQDNSKKIAVAMLSTFPPRECGIAKFAVHLANSLEAAFGGGCDMVMVAMERDAAHTDYPSQVELVISQNDKASYVRAAEALNQRDDVHLVHIQHEFGIFGGEFGSHLLEFTGALRKPFVITYHTVLPEPPPAMRAVVAALSAQASRVITMTETSRRMLMEVYGVADERLVVVLHGIIPMPYEDQAPAKARLGFAGRTILLTFGLLSPNKGIEYVIEALPEIVRNHPEVVYFVVGATHPEIVAREGEWYREKLTARAQELGVAGHVHFHNEFVSDASLLEFLHAADIYIATSLDPNQATSGTLSYAMGSGRPVVSTAFAQAKEIVTGENGALVGFRDPSAYAAAVNRLLDDPELRLRMGYAAFAETRQMTWPNVALKTMRVYAGCDTSFNQVPFRVPPISLEHVKRITDEVGMLQFSVRDEPDRLSGYTVDDNARALSSVARHFEMFHDEASLALVRTYLKFLGLAGRPASFSGLFGADVRPAPPPSPEDNQEDAKGRLVMALAQTAAVPGLPPDLRTACLALLGEWLDAQPDFKSTRAAAFLVIGLVALRRAGHDDPRLEALVTRHCDHLASLYETQRSEGWEWFEPCISYSNGAMCEALLSGGRLLGNTRWMSVGRITLDFLIAQTFIDGRYVAIGQSNWCRRGQARSFHDQQPEDVATMVSALTCMAEIDPTGPYGGLKRLAFEWFLGRNLLGQFAYNVATGGCYDGLGEHAVNLNQGAESTLAYLQARLAVQEL